MIVNLYTNKGFNQVGHLINLRGATYEIIRHGHKLDCLPGGTGIQECEVVKVCDTVTMSVPIQER